MAKKKKHVRYFQSGGKWHVTVSESASPLDEPIEKYEFSSQNAAYQAYRQIKKEQGLGL